MIFFWIFLFLVSFFLIPIVTLPFFLPLLILVTVLYKKPWVFGLAFFYGAILDSFFFRPLGQTSLMLTVFLSIISLYGRKFEVRTVPFIFLSTFFGSLIYLWFFGYQMTFLQSLITALISILLFRFL